jgi:hypothetical protein
MSKLKLLATLAAISAVTLFAEQAAAQRVSGKAFGSYVNASGVTAQSPVAALPETGGYAIGETEAFGVLDQIDAQWLTAVTTGDVSRTVSSSQSTSELENVSALGGAITADVVTAIASSYVNASGAASNAAGSGFSNLAVNGVPVTTEVAPNTRVDLPGTGYAILNEQIPTGDGVTTSGITVNMIHVVRTNLLGEMTGEVIVGSATSSVTP